VRLHRERYLGFNGRHFYQIACRDYAATLSYTYVKLALVDLLALEVYNGLPDGLGEAVVVPPDVEQNHEARTAITNSGSTL
jgi:hypothetical protein